MTSSTLEHHAHALALSLGLSASFLLTVLTNPHMLPSPAHSLLIVGLTYGFGWLLSHLRSFANHKLFFATLTFHLVALGFLATNIYRHHAADGLASNAMDTATLLISSYPLVLLFVLPSAVAGTLLLALSQRLLDSFSNAQRRPSMRASLQK